MTIKQFPKFEPIVAPPVMLEEYDLAVEGYLRLEWEDAVTYISSNSINNFTISKKTGAVTVNTYDDVAYTGFMNSYDDIVDQLNFSECMDCVTFTPDNPSTCEGCTTCNCTDK